MSGNRSLRSLNSLPSVAQTRPGRPGCTGPVTCVCFGRFGRHHGRPLRLSLVVKSCACLSGPPSSSASRQVPCVSTAPACRSYRRAWLFRPALAASRSPPSRGAGRYRSAGPAPRLRLRPLSRSAPLRRFAPTRRPAPPCARNQSAASMRLPLHLRPRQDRPVSSSARPYAVTAVLGLPAVGASAGPPARCRSCPAPRAGRPFIRRSLLPASRLPLAAGTAPLRRLPRPAGRSLPGGRPALQRGLFLPGLYAFTPTPATAAAAPSKTSRPSRLLDCGAAPGPVRVVPST